MDLHILFAQRKQRYAGEYGPEALASMTEYEYSDNPDYLPLQQAEYEKSGEFERLQIITLKTDEEAILQRLFPESMPAVQASLKDEEG